jgi:NLI interacting factor-like phosphatase
MEAKESKQLSKKQDFGAPKPNGTGTSFDVNPLLTARTSTKTISKKKEPKPLLSATDKVILVAGQSQYTNSVHIHKPRTRSRSKQRNGESPAPAVPPSSDLIQIITSCNPPCVSKRTGVVPPGTRQIHVQPLLVLDLNGIVCHRIRKKPGSPWLPSNAYRPALDKIIAMTPIIPRPDLGAFLEFLDHHFCLAIWTSAKAKTAKALVQELFPTAITKRLLFVWAQHNCDAEQTQGDVADVIYRKDLGKVWREFPLWNQHNTLQLDDSPEKCRTWQENVVHPPALNGRALLWHRDEAEPVLSDEENVRQQDEFYKRLLHYWQEHSVTQEWDTEGQDALLVSGVGHAEFLRKHAVGPMGWIKR